MITFPDGSKVGITGLNAAMEYLFQQGKPPDRDTVKEMIGILEDRNYFSPSARNQYEVSLLSEYRRYYEEKSAFQNK